MPSSAAQAQSRIGSVVADKYQIVGELGRGAMGTVYEAINTGLGKHVALKFLEDRVDQSSQTRARFLREAQLASRVEGPHVVHIFDTGWSQDGAPFIVLELLRGEDLRARLRREGRLDVELAVSIITQTLRALITTHTAGIVHRDLKPENIFLSKIDGDTPFVKVLDFGISKVTDASAKLDTLTHEGTVLGTAYYMSPEQARGELNVDGRSDIYAVGAIFYEILTGRTPHTGNVHHAVLVNICTSDAPDVRLLAPQVPEVLARVIATALNRDRELRFADAQAFLSALEPFVRESSGALTRVSPSVSAGQPAAVQSDAPRGPIHQARSGKLMAMLVLAAIVLSALAMFLVNRSLRIRRERERSELWNHAAASTVKRQLQAPSTQPIELPAATPPPPVTPAERKTPTRQPQPSSTHAPQKETALLPRHPAPRADSSATGDLQLKTTMP